MKMKCKIKLRIATARWGLAMTVEDDGLHMAFLLPPVIARSEATRQSVLLAAGFLSAVPIGGCGLPLPLRDLAMTVADDGLCVLLASPVIARRRSRRGNPSFWQPGSCRQCQQGDTDCHGPVGASQGQAMLYGAQRFSIFLCHCEEQSDAAIRPSE